MKDVVTAVLTVILSGCVLVQLYVIGESLIRYLRNRRMRIYRRRFD